MNSKISAVVINFNGINTVTKTIESLYNQKNIDVEVKVIDDHSNDNSVQLIKKSFPELEILVQETNTRNLNKLRNLAIKISTNERVLITDNDIIFDEKCLFELNKVMDTDSKVATCTPRLMYMDNPNLIYSAGIRFHYIGSAICDNRETILNDYDPTPSINSGTGILLLNKDIAIDAGGFDDDLIVMAWGDDGEFYQRMLAFGYKCLYVPTAFALHEEKPFSKERYYRAEGQIYNRLAIIFSHYAKRSIILMMPAFLVYEIIEFGFLLVKGMPHLFFTAFYKIFKKIPLILKKRKVFRKRKTVPDVKILDVGDIYVSHTFLEHNPPLRFLLKIVNTFFELYWKIIKSILN